MPPPATPADEEAAGELRARSLRLVLCRRYGGAAVRVLTALDADEIAQLRGRGEFFWLDLHDPSKDDLAALDDLFGLNPLARRQLRARGQRAKLYLYGDHALIVFWGVSTGQGREGVVRGPPRGQRRRDRHGRATAPVPLCTQLARGPRRRARAGAEQFVLYRILDALTDAFFPVLERMDEEIDAVEDEVLERPTDEQLQRISQLKRELVGAAPDRRRRSATCFPAPVERSRRAPRARAGDARLLPRRLRTTSIRLTDTIDSYRDLLTSAMDVYLSTVSNRLNVVMERLTIVATIFLPLTVLTGFFGMNFGWLVNHIRRRGPSWSSAWAGRCSSSLAVVWWIAPQLA